MLFLFGHFLLAFMPSRMGISMAWLLEEYLHFSTCLLSQSTHSLGKVMLSLSSHGFHSGEFIIQYPMFYLLRIVRITMYIYVPCVTCVEAMNPMIWKLAVSVVPLAPASENADSLYDFEYVPTRGIEGF